jgi:hypothetical protein
MLSYFQVAQELSGSSWVLGITHISQTGSQVDYLYYVQAGNRLTAISYVIIACSTGVLTNDSTAVGFYTDIYSNDLSWINSNAPTGSFNYGFNPKCVLGVRIINRDLSAFTEFDLRSALPTVNFNISDGAFLQKALCVVEHFNCSTIDLNCLQCTSHTICVVCSSHYYPQSYPNITSACLLCVNAILGCTSCTNTSVCLVCTTPTYLLNLTNCVTCATYMDNCLNCTGSTTCTGCLSYYGLKTDGSCVLCSSAL